ncbi:MAG: SET domain-containing protein [Sandaracinaceae bacterium]|nr:SET domain-containing protein [Sandaracinaceae bacterium]
MIHPSTRLCWISDEVGYGVRATRRIPKGTIMWALDPLDRIFGPQEVQRLGAGLWPALETYSYVDGTGNRVLCWDHGRFMNHSCRPTDLSPGVEYEIAVRDIEEGEEITCDYSSLNLESDLHCLCGAPHCRKVIQSHQFVQLAPLWDELLRDAVAHAAEVEQPLLPWVEQPEQLFRWAAHPEELPSSMRHYYPFRDEVAMHAAAR